MQTTTSPASTAEPLAVLSTLPCGHPPDAAVAAFAGWHAARMGLAPSPSGDAR